ncbi:unnamed protein product [Phaedon cochleariae]|uniref:Golgin subfamily A conserved domain-containing protein n=1 Tax=Phaedon cochleariae TaxID=80249 RepID=A0A9N9SE94_PHACE|nr:unnamed protein product [Phaedon cochleariae]
MADSVREHKLKLANSRKRFKELQEQKKKKEAAAQKVDHSTAYDDRQTPADSLTSSAHSSVNNDAPLETITDDKNNSAPLPNYFADTNYGDNFMFFDNISKPEKKADEYIPNNDSKSYKTIQDSTSYGNMLSNIVDNPKDSENQTTQYSGNYSLFPEETPHNYVYETQNILHPNQESPDNGDTYLLHGSNTKQDHSLQYSSSNDAPSLDYPEIKQNEIFEIHNNSQNHNIFSSETGRDIIDCFQSDSKDSLNEVNNSAIKNEIVDNSNNAQEEIRHSSIESLKQFSNHMAEMVEPEYTITSSITDLEKRNLELAALLEQTNLGYEQQEALIEELKFKINTLETDGKRTQESLILQSATETSRLREELQCHIQTVGLLVAEKTELSASLSQLEITAKQKVSECEELQARLKASRSRAFELEQELQILRNDKSKKETVGIEQGTIIEKLRQESTNLREQKEELLQDLLEAREKLKNSSLDNLNLKKQIQEVSSKLSLAEIKIQQISNGEQQQFESQVEKLTFEKFELMKQLSSLNLMLKTMTNERDESTSHYQQYTQELNAQMTNLTNQIQRLQQENEHLSMQEQNRIKHIGELERQLQSLQNDQVAFTRNGTNKDINLKNELESIRELSVQLQIEKTTAEENYTRTMNEKEMLLKELAAKNDSLGQLESMVEQLRGNQPDSVKLLATMESDKVAAARAVQQNKELKEQMDGMREVVAKLDNDKVQLTEKLDFEQSSNKELLDKLQKTELQLQRLTDAIEIKDRELSHLRESSMELNKQILQQEQLADRLRHYEAHDNSSHALQNDLQESKQTIIELTNELNLLKKEKNDEVIDKITSDVTDVKSFEIIDLRKQLDEMKLQNNELQSKLENHSMIDNSFNENDRTADKEAIMRCLEDKVKHTMQDIADLTEEKQRLEHLVLQLQGETETIGEYVALYQHQRMVLKQKVLEKDQQFKQLASDRQEMKNKLEKLNVLIKTLVDEKGSVPKELLKQHQSFVDHSDSFCEEHSKIHKEIGKFDGGESMKTDVASGSETAEEILTLLTEIKSSNLVQPTENFHHCPWCSGQLITV